MASTGRPVSTGDSLGAVGTRYHFITSFQVSCNAARIWSVLQHPESWDNWWKWLKEVEEVESGDESGVGAVIRNEVGTPIGYRLTYVATTTRTVEPTLIEFSAEGDLVGRGQFRLDPQGGGETGVVLNWLVETVKWWMNLAAPIGRPVFSWSHARLMRDFAQGLASAAGASVGPVSDRALSPSDPGFFQLPS